MAKRQAFAHTLQTGHVFSDSRPIAGTGLGLRRDFLQEVLAQAPQDISFYEIAPENWMHLGGHYARDLRALTEAHSFVTHGLSLSLGGPTELDTEFLTELKGFLQQHQIKLYTEHLSYCSDEGHLYDLLPIPFTEDAVHYVAARIRQTQDILEQQIAIENVSYYAAPGKEMDEIDFLLAVLEEADCQLLLDVNNIYVNSINHRYSAEDFLYRIPASRIAYVHVAGHYQEAEDLLVDTHGAAVNNPVWELLRKTYQHFGPLPTLLERDFNIPPFDELLDEAGIISQMQKQQRSKRA